MREGAKKENDSLGKKRFFHNIFFVTVYISAAMLQHTADFT